jgi:hypothetical protein
MRVGKRGREKEKGMDENRTLPVTVMDQMLVR